MGRILAVSEHPQPACSPIRGCSSSAPSCPPSRLLPHAVFSRRPAALSSRTGQSCRSQPPHQRQPRQPALTALSVPSSSLLQLVSPAFIYPVKFAALLSVYRFLCCAGCHLSTLSAHTQPSLSPSLSSLLLTPTVAAALSGVVVSLPHLSPRVTLAHAVGCAAIAATVTLGSEAAMAVETHWSQRRSWSPERDAAAGGGTAYGLSSMHATRAELDQPAAAARLEKAPSTANPRLRPEGDEPG